MAITIEEYERKHTDSQGSLIVDKNWFLIQSMLGSAEVAKSAYGAEGGFVV